MYRFRIVSLAFSLCLLAACGGGGGGSGGGDGAGFSDDGSIAGRDLAGVERAVPSTMGALEAI
ncbi:hypothetical protein [Sulfurifustis variabilis]|nr:hypothetical protein [Sulfurifustis variabilis]